MSQEVGAKFCCDAFAKEATGHKAFAGGGWMYPAGMQPTGQIEQDEDGTWNVNGCCGGGCYVLTKVKFCPFCGASIDSSSTPEKP